MPPVLKRPEVLTPPAKSSLVKAPAILVSYQYVNEFFRNRGRAQYRSWVLDSGAYSALTSGVKIDLNKYIDDAGKIIQQEGSKLKTVFALDVIGDPEATIKNVERMWSQGVKAVPTFHHGSPMHYLDTLGKNYEKIAIGGLVQRGAGGHGSKLTGNMRLRFLEECYSRIWPKWVHGFGCTDPKLMYRIPFASVDSITWYYRVSRYGQIQGYNNLPVQRPKDNRPAAEAAVRVSVNQFLHLEDEARSKLGRVLKKVTDEPFDLCLGVTGSELQYFE